MLEWINKNFNIASVMYEKKTISEEAKKLMQEHKIFAELDNILIANLLFKEKNDCDSRLLVLFGAQHAIDTYCDYGFSEYLPDFLPIADTGGGDFIGYANCEKFKGIYLLYYNEIDQDEAIYIADSLEELLITAKNLSLLYE